MKSLLPRLITAMALLPSLAFGTLILDDDGCLTSSTTHTKAQLITACDNFGLNCCVAGTNFPACDWQGYKPINKLCPNSCNGDYACKTTGFALDVGANSCIGTDACREMEAYVGDDSCHGDRACKEAGPTTIGNNSCKGTDACLQSIFVANNVDNCAASTTCAVDGVGLTVDSEGCISGYGSGSEVAQFCLDNDLDCCVSDPGEPEEPACDWDRPSKSGSKYITQLCKNSCIGPNACWKPISGPDNASGAVDIERNSCVGPEACVAFAGPIGAYSCHDFRACDDSGIFGRKDSYRRGSSSCVGAFTCKGTGRVGSNSCNEKISACTNANAVTDCVPTCDQASSCNDPDLCIYPGVDGCLRGAGSKEEAKQVCNDFKLNCCVDDPDDPNGSSSCEWTGDKIIHKLCEDSCNAAVACSVFDVLAVDPTQALIVGKGSCNGQSACRNTVSVGDYSCNDFLSCGEAGPIGDYSCNAEGSACEGALSVVNCVETCARDTTCSVEGECPSASPSNAPSTLPSQSPSNLPSSLPSQSPSQIPSFQPSGAPTTSARPSSLPSSLPSRSPSSIPSSLPSGAPTTSASPSMSPSFSPCPGLMPITRVYTFVLLGDASGITDTQLLDAFVEAYAQLPKQSCSANLITLAVANRFSSRRLQDSTPELPTVHVEDHIPHRDLQTTTTVTVEVKSTQVADVSIFQDASEKAAFIQSFTTKVQASSGISVGVGSLTNFGGCCNGHVWGDFISRKRCPVDNRGCSCPGPDCCQVCPETFPGQGNPNRMLQEEELEGDICPVKQECITTDGLSGLSLYQEQVTKSFLKGGNTVCVSTCFPVEGTVEMVRSGWTCGVCESREGVPE